MLYILCITFEESLSTKFGAFEPGQIAIWQESEVNLMLAMGKSMLLYNKVDTFESVKNKIEAINSNQLLEVANEMFNLDNLSCLIYKV